MAEFFPPQVQQTSPSLQSYKCDCCKSGQTQPQAQPSPIEPNSFKQIIINNPNATANDPTYTFSPPNGSVACPPMIPTMSLTVRPWTPVQASLCCTILKHFVFTPLTKTEDVKKYLFCYFVFMCFVSVCQGKNILVSPSDDL